MESIAYSPAARNNGLVYSLPLTRLKVTVTYTIETTTRWRQGFPVALAPAVRVVKPARVEATTEADSLNTFVLSGEGLVRDVRLDSSFKFGLSENQLLNSVTAEATDKTTDAIQGLVGSGVTVARLAAVAGPGLSLPDEIRGRLEAIDREVAALAKSGPLKAGSLALLLQEQKALLEYAARYRELNTDKTEEHDVAYSVSFGLRDMEWTATGWRKSVKAPGGRLDAKLNDADVPEVVVEVHASETQHANAGASYVPKAEDKAGVLHRNPVPLRTQISVPTKQAVLFDEPVGFSEAGPVNSLEARYKAFAKRKTAISFSAATGAVKEYGVEATSSAETAAKALDASLSKVQTGLVEVRKAQADAAAAEKSTDEKTLAELDMKRKLAETEAALLKARLEVEKLKAAADANPK